MIEEAKPIMVGTAGSMSGQVANSRDEPPSATDGSAAQPSSNETASSTDGSENAGHELSRLIDRPTGESTSAYKRHKNWSAAQWAWEFLRRNPEFLKASKDIQDTNKDEKRRAEVAKEFGLAKFKSAGEGFKKPYPPEFLVATPPVSFRLKEDDESAIEPMEVGEVIARINLNIAFSDKHALNLQLNSIKTLAAAALVRFASASGKKKPVGRRNRADRDASNLDLLRVLDLLAAREKGHDFNDQRIMKILFPSKLEPKASGNDWRKFLSRVKDRANDMASHGYVKLVRAHSGKK